MKKLSTILQTIWAALKRAFSADKVAHFCACYAIAVTMATVLRKHDCDIFVALLSGIGAAIGKEAYDKARGGTFDTWDLLAGFLGTFAGAICAILLLVTN